MAEGTTTSVAGSVSTGTSVLVRYFAAAAEAAGVEEERIEFAGLADQAPTVGALRDLLVERYGPAMARVVANGSFLVDGVVRRDPATPLGAQVDVLPPFAGG
ncbi:MoaD/ThiS family protein [Agromyces aurantiacus]|uniref:MoaD/ThiS family protein n=1 Tax=Agromyces aurantiacus TaxID=165814 RepID=A0ABV9R2D4_9MICO|nr:MoaD/ThiS family protein [Agromyces aurantiacus]MBM7506064.1 molybdopterin converting factor small subunit [Agromyces aurantiacus]